MTRKLGAACAVAVALTWIGPAAAEAESPERGAEIYADLCAGCHGRYGRGDGPLADDLAVRPPDFTDPSWMAGRSTEQIVEGLRGASHAPMAMARVLDEGSLRDAVTYVRTLAGPGGRVSVAEGRDIYNATCWVCHGRDGNGEGPAAANLDGPAPRDFTSSEFTIEGREDEIARTIAKGAQASFHGSPLMLEWGSSLSQRQIRGLVEYLKTFKRR